jgi:BMFP domain-containing protein YqiC
MDTFRIDEIARRLMENVPPAFRSVQKDLESNFRAVLRASLNKLDLVTRDEFDTQSRVLERTRARLEALEARLQAMEGGAAGAASPATETPAAGTPGGGVEHSPDGPIV